jgi:enamine deaminase RidA (YjgF/YER057c/UK114 family)
VASGIELVRPPGLTGTAPYAYAAVTDPGRMVFTAGACPLDADGATVAVGDVAGQARQVMANLTTALEAAGAGLGDVLRTTVFVATTQRSDLTAAWEVVRAAFGDHDAPSTLVGVTVLGWPDQLVEVEAVAVRDSWEEPAPPHDGPDEGE